MKDLLRAVGERFAIEGAFREARRHGSGHIHDTLVASFERDGATTRFLFQRLNTGIFRDPDALMDNLARVTAHVRSKLAARGVPDLERRCLSVVRTREGGLSHTDDEGGVWRAFPFVENTCSYDVIESPAQATAAALAFGEFAALLADLPPPPLAVTIPHFHDLAVRAGQLEEAVSADARGRLAGAVPELEAARRFTAWIQRELGGATLADLPQRPVHHDCKLNNLLFDVETGEALCVVDLDTAMPGSLLSDFGHLVRTGTCRSPEDETDLAAIRVDPELYAALTRGWVEGAAAILDESEIEVLHLAPPLLTLIDAVRFLADHLAGDVYFPAHREGHNLDRARAQLRLVEVLVEGLPHARSLVRAAVTA